MFGILTQCDGHSHEMEAIKQLAQEVKPTVKWLLQFSFKSHSEDPCTVVATAGKGIFKKTDLKLPIKNLLG